MVRENNYSRVFDHYYTGSVYYKKGDDLRYNPDDRQIYDRGTPIAYMVTDNYDDYIVVDAHKYQKDNKGNRHKDNLVKYAMNNNIRVIFVPYIDVGFGKQIKSHYTPTDAYEYLLKLRPAKYRTLDAVCIYGDYQGIAWTFAQNGVSATSIMLGYIWCVQDDLNVSLLSLVSLQELNYEELSMLTEGSPAISNIIFCCTNPERVFQYDEQDKYLDLCDRIWSRQLKIDNRPIHYDKRENLKVIKYVDKYKGEIKC